MNVDLETKPFGLTFSLGNLSLDRLWMTLNSVWATDFADMTQVWRFYTVDGQFSIDGHLVTLSVMVDQSSSPLLDFTAEVDVTGLGLLSVTKAIGLPDLSNTLPEQLQKIVDSIELQTVQFGYAPDAATTSEKINYIGLSIGTTTPWIIIDKWLEIEHITVNWKVFEPFSSDQRQFHNVISGQFKLAGADWQIQAQMPNFNISAWLLTDGEGLNLSDWFKTQFNISLPDVVKDVDISSLSISYEASGKIFGLTSDWTFGESAKTTLTLGYYGEGAAGGTDVLEDLPANLLLTVGEGEGLVEATALAR
jgi:hypothetical protein